jgi:hypothetical protein
MGIFSNFVKSIKKNLFGKAQDISEEKQLKPSDKPEEKASAQLISDQKKIDKILVEQTRSDTPIKETKVEVTPVKKTGRDPYFLQIGLDFGTSYTKCICRDIMTNKAWVHHYSRSIDKERPFLIPSLVIVKENKIFHTEDTKSHYPLNGLFHLKNALVLAANGDIDNPQLATYRDAVKLKNKDQLPSFIATCAVYYLAGVIGEIKSQIKLRFKGFGELPEDYIAINMAIPVDNAQDRRISRLFNIVLCEAWGLSDELSGLSYMDITKLVSLIKNYRSENKNSSNNGCFIYPEVSANVQGFIRSRVSSPGVYLFSDAGGGTVDQSVFIFTREDVIEHLHYLAGQVLPLGSSQIENRIAQKCGDSGCKFLELWRERKERSENHNEINEAKNWIAGQLRIGTKKTLALSKKKLFNKDQLNDIRVIFGGGGHCDFPYKKAVMEPFTSNIFREELHPDEIGMPVPKDLDLKEHEYKWMNRLNVAYGLSFEQGDLAPYTFPPDDPKPEEIWHPTRPLSTAPTKDEC